MVFLRSLIFIFLIAACGSNALALEKTSLYLKWDHQFQFAGYYAAKEKGFFKAAGFDVEIVSRIDEKGNIKGLYDPIVNREVDFSVGGSDIIKYIAEGADLYVVANFFQNSPFGFFSLKEKGIKSPIDLLGKKIMISHGDFSKFEIMSLLHYSGAKDKSYTEAPWDFTSKPIYAKTADVKATYILSAKWETKDETEQLEYFKSSDFGLHFYGDLLVAHGDLVRTNPDKVERFKQAVIKGWIYALENPEEISKLIVSKYPAKIEKYDNDYEFNMFSSKIIRELMDYPYVEVGHVSQYRWQKINEVLVDIKVIDKIVETNNYIFDYKQVLGSKNKSIFDLVKYVTFGAGLFFFFAFIVMNKQKNEDLTKLVEERTKSLKESKSKKEELGYVVENSINEVYVFDFETRKFRYVNSTAKKNLGYSSEELKSMGPLDLKRETSKEDFEKVIKPLVDDPSQKIFFNERHYRKDGTNYPVEVHLQVGDFGDNKSFIAIILDVTIRHEIQSQMFQTAKLASIGELSAGVGHEVNNPLTICSGNLKILNKRLEELEFGDEKVSKAIGKIAKGHERIAKIVKGLRVYSRKDEITETTQFNVKEAIEETLDLLDEIYSKQGVEVIKEIPDVDTKVEGSFGHFQQVLMNLMSNARDATEKRGDRVIRISLDVTDPEWTVIKVKDNGTGIPENVRDKIFEPFFTTKDIGKGTGLGMGMIQQLVAGLHGSISFETEVGNGTTFFVKLPKC